MIATLLNERQFDLIARALDNAYYYDDPNGRNGRITKDFEEFSQFAESLNYRNQRLNDNRADWQADFIEQNYQTGAPSFARMMEADLLLYLRRPVVQPGDYFAWFPHTLIYASQHGSALELFARMESAKYFALVSEKLFGSVDVATFKERVNAVSGTRLWRNTFSGLNVSGLAGLQHIASRA